MNSNRQSINNGERYTTETDPLLLSPHPGYSGTSTIRERRPHSSSRNNSPYNSNTNINSNSNSACSFNNSSPSVEIKDSFMNTIPSQHQQSSFAEVPEAGRVPPPAYGDEPDASYEMYTDNDNGVGNDNDIGNNSSRPIRSLRSIRSAKSQRESKFSRTFSDGRNNDERGDRLHQYYNERANRIFSEPPQPASDEPLVEVSEDILAVRKSALRVYEPLTYTWVSLFLTITICTLCTYTMLYAQTFMHYALCTICLYTFDSSRIPIFLLLP